MRYKTIRDGKPREVIRLLEKHNFAVVRSTGHIQMSDGQRRISIPHHKTIKRKTMADIQKASGIEKTRFWQEL